MKIILFASLLAMSGCASLQYAGNATYELTPVPDASGNLVCCSVKIFDGKEIASLNAHVVKSGDTYTVDLVEQGVKAFAGTAIAAGAAQSAASTAGKVAVAAALAGAAPVLIPAIGGIAATSSLGAAAVGAGGAVVGQKLLAPASGAKP